MAERVTDTFVTVPVRPDTIILEGYSDAGPFVVVGWPPGTWIDVVLANGHGVAVGDGAGAVVISNVQPPAMIPPSPKPKSRAYKFHTPFGFVPPKAVRKVATPFPLGPGLAKFTPGPGAGKSVPPAEV